MSALYQPIHAIVENTLFDKQEVFSWQRRYTRVVQKVSSSNFLFFNAATLNKASNGNVYHRLLWQHGTSFVSTVYIERKTQQYNEDKTAYIICRQLWSVIRFLSANGATPPSIHEKIMCMYSDEVISNKMVRQWENKFWEESQTDIHDMTQSSRPSGVVNTNAITAVRVVVDGTF